MKWPFVSRKKHVLEISGVQWRLEKAQRRADEADRDARQLYDARLRDAIERLPEMQEEVHMLARMHCDASVDRCSLRSEIDFGIRFSISRQFIQHTAGIEGAIEYIAKQCAGQVRRGILDPKQLNVASIIAEALK